MKKSTKIVKVLNRHHGCFIRIKWDDVGCVDGICVDGASKDDDIKIFTFDTNNIQSVNKDQVVKIGPRISQVPLF